MSRRIACTDMRTRSTTWRFKHRRSNRLGMTLIELIVGIVVTGAAIAAGYATFSTLVDQHQRAKTSVDHVARGAAIRRQLTNWVQDGHISGSSGLDDRLDWSMLGQNPLGGPTEAVLFVNTDNPRYQRGLVVQFVNMAMSDFIPDTMIVPLDSTIIAIRVIYLASKGSVRSWMTMKEIIQSDVDQVLAVRLQFVSSDPVHLTPLLHLPLLITMFRT